MLYHIIDIMQPILSIAVCIALFAQMSENYQLRREIADLVREDMEETA